MKNCMHCNKEINDTDRYCINCMNELDAKQEIKKRAITSSLKTDLILYSILCIGLFGLVLSILCILNIGGILH